MQVDYLNNCTLAGLVPAWLCTQAQVYLYSPGANESSGCSGCEATELFDAPTNPDPVAEESSYDALLESSRFWIQRVLVPIITIIGVIGNSVTIVIMTRRRMRSSTNNYLAALAIVDMLYLLGGFALSLKHYEFIQEKGLAVYFRCFPFLILLTDTCSNTSVWLTATFTVERYIAVCHPIKGKVLCTESRARKAVIGVVVFCFALTLPTPFEYAVIEESDPGTNATRVSLSYSEFGRNELYKKIYYWLTVVLFTLVPFCLLAIFNAFLVRSVHVSRRQRSKMTQRTDSSRDNQENKITVMLIAVVILFFLCQLPTAMTLLYTSIRSPEEGSEQEKLVFILGNIFNFLMSLNAAGNFVLYCLLSQKYRRTFLQIFCPCAEGRFVRLQSVYQYTGTAMNQTDDTAASRRLSSVRSARSNSMGPLDANGKKSPPARACLLNVPEDAGADSRSCDAASNAGRSGPGSFWSRLRRSAGSNGGRSSGDKAKDCVVVITAHGVPENRCVGPKV
ncbi:FMRFamide receptor-like [Amblyomma americanum]